MNKKIISMLVIVLFLFHLQVTPSMAQEIEGHTNFVNAIDWSEDGTKIATGSTDTNLIVWNEDGTLLDVKKATFGHNQSILDVEWSKGDKYIVTSSLDNSVFGWNTTIGETIPSFIFTGHNQFTKEVAVNPTSNTNLPQIASGGRGTTVVVYNVSSDKTVTSLNISTVDQKVSLSDHAPRSIITGLDWSGDGVKLVTGGTDMIVRIYEISAVGTIQSVEYNVSEPILALDMSDDGTKVVVGTPSQVLTYEILGSTLLEKSNPVEIDCGECLNMDVELSPDETMIAIGANTKLEVYPWSPNGISGSADFSVDVVLDLGMEENIDVPDLSWHPDNERLAFVAGADVLVYNSATGDEIFRNPGELPVERNLIGIVSIIFIIAIIVIFLIRRQLSK